MILYGEHENLKHTTEYIYCTSCEFGFSFNNKTCSYGNIVWNNDEIEKYT